MRHLLLAAPFALLATPAAASTGEPVNPWVALAYLISGVFFILALRGLSSPATSRTGNRFGMVGMLIAVVTTLVTHVPGSTIVVYDDGPTQTWFELDWATTSQILIAIAIGAAIGLVTARRIAMTAMPELVAAFHSLVGLAAVLVGWAAYLNPGAFGLLTDTGIAAVSKVEMGLGIAIGAITFSGSVIAFAKLSGKMSGSPILLPARHVINLGVLAAIIVLTALFALSGPAETLPLIIALTVLAFAIGFLLIIPIGGADMPVVVSMLNSYSGWAAAAMGFTLGNSAMIITGALVGSSGAILSYIMCRAMNRSLANVIFGGFGTTAGATPAGGEEQGTVTETTAEEVADMMNDAGSVVFVPGYGMAVAQAQHVIYEISETLRGKGVEVRFAIHPVAGRLPGHMNVLLAEARVPYDIVFEMDEVNEDLPETDLVVVVGANDIVNPSALEDTDSHIAGMPVIEAWNARTVIALKRSMAAGYSGVENPLYYRENTRMLFGDAKETLTAVSENLG